MRCHCAERSVTPARGSGQAEATRAASWSTSRFLAGLQLTGKTSLKRKLCQILAFEDLGKLLFQGKRVANWDFSQVDCFSKIFVKGLGSGHCWGKPIIIFKYVRLK